MPCVSAVFPAPSGPTRTTRSPGRRTSARARPSACVSSGAGSRCSRFTAAPFPSEAATAAGRPAAPPGGRRSARTGWPPTGGRSPRAPARRSRADRASRACASTVRGPRNHFAADRPSATTTGGSSSSSWRRSQPLQRATSGAFGVRLPGGRHLTMFSTAASARDEPGLAEQLVEQRAGPADERPAGLVLGRAGRLPHEREQRAARPRARHRRRRAAGPRPARGRPRRAGRGGEGRPVRRGGGDAGHLVGARVEAGRSGRGHRRTLDPAVAADEEGGGLSARARWVTPSGTTSPIRCRRADGHDGLPGADRPLRHRLPRRRRPPGDRHRARRPRRVRPGPGARARGTRRRRARPAASGRGGGAGRRRHARPPVGRHDPLAAQPRRAAHRPRPVPGGRRPAAPTDAPSAAGSGARPGPDGRCCAGWRLQPPVDRALDGGSALRVALGGRAGDAGRRPAGGDLRAARAAEGDRARDRPPAPRGAQARRTTRRVSAHQTRTALGGAAAIGFIEGGVGDGGGF